MLGAGCVADCEMVLLVGNPLGLLFWIYCVVVWGCVSFGAVFTSNVFTCPGFRFAFRLGGAGGA